MAIYRTVSMNFWTDSKVVDDFTPEDRYFYLYLFTNPHTNLCGCYEISVRQMANEIGYSKNSVENLLERFEKVHKVIAYCQVTKEIFLLNWYKYNWIKSEKFQKALVKEIGSIKDERFRNTLKDILNGGDTVSIRYEYGIDITGSDSATVTDAEQKYPYREVVDYLNEKAGTKYKYTSADTRSHIRARIDSGFSLDDFKTVIDKKVAEWKGTDMEQYLRPVTLFGTKFESYLNQKTGHRNTQRRNGFNNFQQRDYDYADLERQLTGVG